MFQNKVSTQAELDSLHEIISRLKFYEGILLNDSGNTTLAAITLKKDKLDSKERITLVENIEKLVRASIGNRAKESLLVDFINQTDLDSIRDKASIIEDFYKFAQAEQLREVNELIVAENLNEEATRRYISISIKREFASENGTELNAILPKMSPLNTQYLTKKQSVFEKISAFVEKFKCIGGKIN